MTGWWCESWEIGDLSFVSGLLEIKAHILCHSAGVPRDWREDDKDRERIEKASYKEFYVKESQNKNKAQQRRKKHR